MRIIFVIALNSLREFIRDKVVLLSAFIAGLLILLSLFLGSLSFGEQERILADFGMTAIHLAGLGISVFFGSFVIHRELERQTCLLVLARPVDRAQFILGKYFGILMLNTIIWLILSVVLYSLLGFKFQIGYYFLVLTGIWVEQAVLTSISLSASTFLRPSVALFACLTVFFAGNSLDEAIFFMKKTNIEIYITISKVVEKILPNFFEMNWRSTYFLEKGVPLDQFLWVLFHGLGWIMLPLSFGIIVFRRKDLV